MLKKILGYIGLCLTGLNFGIISCVFPLFIAPFVMTGLKTGVLAGSALLCAAIAGVSLYIYSYKQKREHEEVSKPLTATVIAFIIGAVIITVVLFTLSGSDEGIVSHWG